MGVPKPGGAVWGSEVENWSVTFVEKKSVNFVGWEVFLCVSTATLGRICVCVCWGVDLSTWVWHLGGQSDAKPS